MPETNDTPPEGIDIAADETVSRRRVVTGGIAAIGAAAIAAATLGRAANAAAAAEPLSTRVVVSDPTLCVGCLACEVNCSTWHASVGRSAMPRIRVLRTPTVALRKEVSAFLPGRAGFSPATCRQCPTPWCVPNCPTDGLRVDPKTGNRYINEAACIACGKCEVDCPVEWKGTLALRGQAVSSKRVTYDAEKDVFNKCDLCIGRDGGPICVERCPVNGAIQAGYIRSSTLCLDLAPATEEQWKKLV